MLIDQGSPKGEPHHPNQPGLPEGDDIKDPKVVGFSTLVMRNVLLLGPPPFARYDAAPP